MNLSARIHAWTHGTKGLELLYVIFAAASLAGLKQGRETGRSYVLWPFTTLVTLFAVGLGSEFILTALSKLIGQTSTAKTLASLALYIAGGFLGGLFWARLGRPLAAIARPRAMLFDGQAAQRETRKLRAKAGPQAMPLTVAGVAVPFEDEMNASNSSAPPAPARAPRSGSCSPAR